MRSSWLGLGVVGYLACLSACGDSEGDAGPTVLACQLDEFRLSGTIDGEAVEISEPPNGGITQFGTGTFEQNRPFGSTTPDPTKTRVQLEWGEIIAHGQARPVTGTAVLPSGAPRGGETLCAGSGSSAAYDEEGNFGFSLLNLTAGASCTEPVAGTLDGCWRSDFGE